MAQHYLMSGAARTLSLIDLCDLSEDAAHKMLCGMRWPDTDGAPICPHCSCAVVYTYRCRRLFKCKGLPPAVLGDQRNLARVPKACRFGRCSWLSACSSTPPRASAVFN